MDKKISKVLTIYNHGTGGATAKSYAAGEEEIVNAFEKIARQSGLEGKDWLVTQGVGRKGGPDRMLSTFTFDKATQQAVLTRHEVTPSAVRLSDYSQAAGDSLRDKTGSKTGGFLSFLSKSGPGKGKVGKAVEDAVLQASGIGADENVQYILSVLKSLAHKKELPDTINMMGWSRGAVTCIRIAHFMNIDPLFSHIPINIFAVDPVAGAGHDNEVEAYTIGRNVKNYVATLAVDEVRKGFNPMVPPLLQISTQCNYAIIDLPGIHSDTAKGLKSSSGKLTFHLCQKFLLQHGSNLDNQLVNKYNLQVTQQLAEYSKILEGHHVSKAKKKNDTMAILKAGIATQDRAAKSSFLQSYFANPHHLEIFKKSFPITFQKFFTPLANQKGQIQWQTMNNAAWGAELQRLDKPHLDALAKFEKYIGIPPIPSQHECTTIVSNNLHN